MFKQWSIVPHSLHHHHQSETLMKGRLLMLLCCLCKIMTMPFGTFGGPGDAFFNLLLPNFVVSLCVKSLKMMSSIIL